MVPKLAYDTWNCAENQSIKVEDVHKAYSKTICDLDEVFFKVYFDRLTNREIEVVKSMAQIGEGP